MAVSLISIGYEGLTIDALISRLRIHGVSVLADVRLNAISRKKGFSKKALATSLQEAGIEYLHVPELGNHRDNRAGYAEPGTVGGDVARGAFAEVLTAPAAQEALRNLLELASSSPIAVFCYEADETQCHREQVLEELRRSAVAAV